METVLRRAIILDDDEDHHHHDEAAARHTAYPPKEGPVRVSRWLSIHHQHRQASQAHRDSESSEPVQCQIAYVSSQASQASPEDRRSQWGV